MACRGLSTKDGTTCGAHASAAHDVVVNRCGTMWCAPLPHRIWHQQQGCQARCRALPCQPIQPLPQPHRGKRDPQGPLPQTLPPAARQLPSRPPVAQTSMQAVRPRCSPMSNVCAGCLPGGGKECLLPACLLPCQLLVIWRQGAWCARPPYAAACATAVAHACWSPGCPPPPAWCLRQSRAPCRRHTQRPVTRRCWSGTHGAAAASRWRAGAGRSASPRPGR